MSDYDDEIDEELDEIDQPEGETGGGAASGGNRNFMIALGILGGIFLLVTIGLVALYMSGPRSTQTANINATNDAILAANTQTAVSATQVRAVQLTQVEITPTPEDTPVPPTPTNTQVVALATETSTPDPLATESGTPDPALGIVTSTPGSAETLATSSVPSVLTQAAQQTETQQAGGGQAGTSGGAAGGATPAAGTATALPSTGFAEDVGLPGMFGMALGLVLMIVLVRRMRLSTR